MKHTLILVTLLFYFSIAYAQPSALTLNDSAMAVYKSNPEKALTILEQALKISEEKNNQNLIAKSKNNLGIVYRDLGRFETAKALSMAALNTTDSLILGSAHNNIGVVNRNLALYDEAIASYLKALSIYEKKQLEREIATTHNSIGLVYSYNGVNDKAIEYHLKAKAVFEKLEDKKGISEVYNNIAIIYANDGQLQQSLDYFKYSLEIENSLNDKKGIAESVNNVGAVYYYLGEIDSALVYFNKSVKIEKSIGNQAGVAASYNNIADVLIEINRVKDSKKFIDSAMYFANQSKVSVDVEAALHNYSKYYEAKNDHKQALSYYKTLTSFRDSVLNINTNEKIAQLEIEYQTEKKEKEILSQRADLAENELSLNEKNTQLLGLGVLTIILGLLGYIFYNQQKLKNKQLKKENELKDALLKIENQNRLQEQRLNISRDLHDNIGAQLTFIISSIDNLKYGFNLPEKLGNKLETISDFTTTTIFELRDTIWAMNKTSISIEDLQSRMSNFIDKANNASDRVTFKFVSNISELEHLQFSSVEGMHIYRIIQEGINNALKYSEAKHIAVDFEIKFNQFHARVTDDGKGFLSSEVELGNGLNNMKKRAQEIDATLTINSKLGEGTVIEFKL